MFSRAPVKLCWALLQARTELAFCVASAVALTWLWPCLLGEKLWHLAEVFGAYLLGLALPALGLGCLLARLLRRRTLLPVHGKAVLITGCDRGFGNRLARRLDAKGYQVFAGCLAADGEECRALDEETSSRTRVLQLDVTDDAQVQRAVQTVQHCLGANQLWGVVTNAGINVFLEFEWLTQEETRRMFDVNVHGTLRVLRACLPQLRRSRGRIVVVASQAGRLAPPWIVPYSATKAAVIALADGLRRELCKWGVGVSTVEPYYYATDINPKSEEQMLRHYGKVPETVRAAYGSRYPREAAGRTLSFLRWASRTDVGEVVDAMERALTQARPERYYRCDGTLSWIFHLLLFNLPSFFADAAVSVAMDVDYVPDAAGVLRPSPTVKTELEDWWALRL